MENERFDRMTRLLGAGATRRGALAALLGVGVLGTGAEAAKKRARRRRRRKHGQDSFAGPPTCAIRGPGQDLSHCDFTGQDLRGKNLSGSQLSGAQFTSANLCGADLSGTDLASTDFTSAVLTRADLRGTNLPKAIVADAVFCRTRLPDGRLDNSGCPPGTGDVCCDDADCAGGRVCSAQRCVCPDGTVELANGSCAILCGQCPDGCACQVFSSGPNLCTVFPPETTDQQCSTTADCDPGYICFGFVCQALCPLQTA